MFNGMQLSVSTPCQLTSDSPALCITAYPASLQRKYARSCCRLLDGEVPEHEFQPSPFFAEQLCAFELWLDAGSQRRRPPEQLPIVLQASADISTTRRYSCTRCYTRMCRISLAPLRS